MDLRSIPVSHLESLPIRGLGAVVLRAAIRVRSHIEESDASVAVSIDMAIRECRDRLNDPASGPNLDELSETLYLMASGIAAKYRAVKSPDLHAVTYAAAAFHSAVDCIADLDHDAQSALSSAMMVIRSTAKIGDSNLDRAVNEDLRLLESLRAKESTDKEILAAFELSR